MRSVGSIKRVSISTLLVLVSVFSSVTIMMTTAMTYALSAGNIIAMTNQIRAQQGLPQLSVNGALMASSQMKASDMFAQQYWAHTAPNGSTPWTFMYAAGYPIVTAGENLAKDYASDAGVVNGWMNSPTHRANILNPAFRDIGVSIMPGTLNGSATTIVVAHYGQSSVAPTPAPAPAPAPVAKVAPAPAPAPAPRPAAPVARVAPAPVTPAQIAEPASAPVTPEPQVSTPRESAPQAIPVQPEEQKTVGRYMSYLEVRKYNKPFTIRAVNRDYMRLPGLSF